RGGEVARSAGEGASLKARLTFRTHPHPVASRPPSPAHAGEGTHGNRPHSFGTHGNGSEPPRARSGQLATECVARAPHLQRQSLWMADVDTLAPKSFSASRALNTRRLRHVPQRTMTPSAPSEMAFCNEPMAAGSV